MKNLDYRGYKSTTLRLVVMTALGATALLLWDKVPASSWENIVMASVIAYAFKEVGSKTAEAIRDKDESQSPD